MSEQQFEQYLADLADHLDLPAGDRQRIRAELRAHLEDHLQALANEGAARGEAIQQALAELGRAQGLGEQLTRVHRRATWPRAIAGLAALVVLTAIWQSAWHALAGRQPNTIAPAIVTAGDGEGLATLMDRPHESEQPSQAEAALERVVPEVNLKDATLEEAVGFLRETLDCNIWVNWARLEQFGVSRDAEINIVLRDVPAHRLLQILCMEMSPHEPVGFGVAANVLEIAPLEALQAAPVGPGTELRLYDVRDLVRAQRPGQPPDLRPPQEELLEVIECTVDPRSWQDEHNVTINIFDGQLIVRQRPDDHAMIEHLIAELRHRPRASQTEPSIPGPQPAAGYEMDLINLEAELAEAQVRLEQARRDLERSQNLLDRGGADMTLHRRMEANVRLLEIECQRLERKMELLHRMQASHPEPMMPEHQFRPERQLPIIELEEQLDMARERLAAAEGELERHRQGGTHRRHLDELEQNVRALREECEKLERELVLIRQRMSQEP